MRIYQCLACAISLYVYVYVCSARRVSSPEMAGAKILFSPAPPTDDDFSGARFSFRPRVLFSSCVLFAMPGFYVELCLARKLSGKGESRGGMFGTF